MTALWHEQQKAIQAGERDAASFIRELMEYIAGEVRAVKVNGIGIAVEAPRCPECQRPLRRIKGKKGFFWGCTGFREGCPFSCPDKGGKPVDLERRRAPSGGGAVVFPPAHRPIQMPEASPTIANIRSHDTSAVRRDLQRGSFRHDRTSHDELRMVPWAFHCKMRVRKRTSS